MNKIYKLKPIPKSKPQTLEMMEKFKKEPFLHEIFIGKILGDACINKTGNLCFSQSVKQKDYVEHCFDLFKSYIRPNRQIKSYMNKRNDKLHEILSFETCAIFKDYLPLFYKNEEITNRRIKIIPSNISEMLTARAIAYWFMDDGCYYSTNRVMLCTHSFTLEENTLLSEVLNKKFSLKCSLISVKQPKNPNYNWYPLIIEKSYDLKDLIKAYLLPSFNYKFTGKK